MGSSRTWLAGALGMALLLPVGGAAQDKQKEPAEAARPSDTVANRLASADPVERFATALQQIDALRVYNEQMRELISAQQSELTSLNEQVARVEVVERSIPELLIKMVDALEKFVELDVPFELEERRKRVNDLKLTLRKADVTDAERYRQIMEAYTIENEYGRTIGADRSTLKRADGSELPVDYLRFGRVALIYQTLDESEAGIWDQSNRTWVPLDDDYASSIRQALRIARKQAAPDLVTLPLPAAGGAS